MNASATFQGMPPEALVHVFRFLSVESVVAVTSTNRRLRHDVAPLLPEMWVSSTKEMNPKLQTRFPNVQVIHFAAERGIVITKPSFTSRLIPFLTAFGNLEWVGFEDAIKVAVIFILRVPMQAGGNFDAAEHAVYANRITTIVHLLCDAYLSEELSSTVKVEGLFCPWPHQPEDASSCQLCRHVIRGIPIPHLLGRDENDAPSLTFPDVPGCLSRRRDIHEWMFPILMDRLESIPLALGRDAGMILYQLLNG